MAKKKTPLNFLSEINVTVQGENYTLNVEHDVSIDPNDLQAAYVDQPGKYAWYAVLASRAKNAADLAKSYWADAEENLKKTVTAELAKDGRESLEAAGKKPTESMVMNEVYTHPRYINESNRVNKLQLKYLEAQAYAQDLEAIREAFYHRKDMVVSLGAQIRHEYDNV